MNFKPRFHSKERNCSKLHCTSIWKWICNKNHRFKTYSKYFSKGETPVHNTWISASGLMLLVTLSLRVITVVPVRGKMFSEGISLPPTHASSLFYSKAKTFGTLLATLVQEDCWLLLIPPCIAAAWVRKLLSVFYMGKPNTQWGELYAVPRPHLLFIAVLP